MPIRSLNDTALEKSSPAPRKLWQRPILLLWAAYWISRIKLIASLPRAQVYLNQKWIEPHKQFVEIFAGLLFLSSCIFFAWLIIEISRGKRYARGVYLVFTLVDFYDIIEAGVQPLGEYALQAIVCLLEAMALFNLYVRPEEFIPNKKQMKK